MKLAIVLSELSEVNLTLAAQIGVQEIVSGIPAAHGGSFEDFRSLIVRKQQIENAGLGFSTVEALPVSDRIRLGKPGREEDLEVTLRLLRNMGEAGLTVACYNFMAVFGWLRTSMTTRTRGGALTSAYDHALMQRSPPTTEGEVSEELLWDSLAWFLERAVPVAEECGVRLALHPDDPPLSPIAGVARIIRSVEAFERVMALADSTYNGITFCQGNFDAMGADVPAAIRSFGAAGRIHFAHFRDVTGKVPKFRESFHDDTDGDMAATMQAFLDIGLDGPIRPDHTPTLEGESNDRPGYHILGRLHAIGYMQGLLAALQSPARPG